MVYSTCSLNPIEDEAVVCALLQEAKGGLELVDPRPRLPGLRVRDGLHTWRVVDSEARLGLNTAPPAPEAAAAAAAAAAAEKEEAEEESEEKILGRLRGLGLRWLPSYADVPDGCLKNFRPSHFPPQDPAVAARLNLQYCMRCLPHDQDTGGFFVALIRKVAPFGGGGASRRDKEKEKEKAKEKASPDAATAAAAAATTAPATPVLKEGATAAAAAAAPAPAPALSAAEEEEKEEGGGGKKKGGQGQRHERFSSFEPKEFFTPLPEDAWADIRAFYGVQGAFHRERLFCRRDTAKVVSYMAKGLVADVKFSADSNLQVTC